MRNNRSPWIHQLNHDRPQQQLTGDERSDVVIVGAGIAGMATAYFLLTRTNKNVIVVEGGKLAHGATGHNAGQVVSYFERGFSSLVDEFGLARATAGQKAVEDAWSLLDEIYSTIQTTIPFARFVGHAGLTSLEQVILHLKNNELRKAGGLPIEECWVADDALWRNDIPEAYAPLYMCVPREKIAERLETTSPSYGASISYPKGVINSALLCEELLEWLNTTYTDRFRLYEHTRVEKIILNADGGILDTGTHTVAGQRIVLCTNGFENLTIINKGGLNINTEFHHLVEGNVGYMSAYLEEGTKPATAISYLENPSADTSLSYFYITRRPYEYDGSEHNLISVGGPGFDIDDTRSYRNDHEFPDEVATEIDRFVRTTYNTEPNRTIDYQFTWHGLMGYTKHGIRLIGPDPRNPVLLYNLGCNGIGILPSLHGGLRISECITHPETIMPSIFDVPRDVIESA